MASSFRALKNRNYQLYFAGQLISLVGTGMQQVVQSWLVYQLSHSAAWLGAITFFALVPAFFVSPFAGILIDRWNRRKILIWVQVLSMIQALALAGLVFSGKVQIWHVAALSVVIGVLNAFEITTRHAFAVDLVGKEDLSSAIAMNSATINSSRILGSALAGVLLAPLGEGWCFALNGFSFLAVILGLLLLKSHQAPHVQTVKTRFFSHLAEALRYVRHHPLIGPLIALAVVFASIGFPYAVLLPTIAQVVFHGDATTYAWLSGIGGLGAVIGAVLAGTQTELRGSRSRILLFLILMGVSMAVFGASRNFILSCAALFAMSFFMMGAFPIINTSIQQAVDDSMRGRVLSLYTMTFFGATPIGSLLAGWAADRFGAPNVAIAGGVLCTGIGALAFAMRGDKH